MERVRANLSLSPTLYAWAKERADAIGVTVNTYITTLLVVDKQQHTRAGVRSAKEEK